MLPVLYGYATVQSYFLSDGNRGARTDGTTMYPPSGSFFARLWAKVRQASIRLGAGDGELRIFAFF